MHVTWDRNASNSVFKMSNSSSSLPRIGEDARGTICRDEVLALLGRSKFSPLLVRFLENLSVRGTPFEASICCWPWLGATEPRDALVETVVETVEAMGWPCFLDAPDTRSMAVKLISWRLEGVAEGNAKLTEGELTLSGAGC